MTISEVLLDGYGWPQKFLSPSGEIARYDVGEWQGSKTCGFRPFSFWQRILNSDSFLPFDLVLPIGCKIRFDSKLRGDPEFIGFLEPMAHYSFPFDEWLETSSPALLSEYNTGEGFYFMVRFNKKTWACSYPVLTFLHDVSICTSRFD